ncbi:ribonuclease E/G [Eubacterium xylanophilum]|uniref:ribonuclease E/G n=1 Tax=Eubacterium xylanophilum TaxID=39497 RepID=UPI0004AF5843|nr:ribonuclease E/G [Eubacterium xylanophilum]
MNKMVITQIRDCYIAEIIRDGQVSDIIAEPSGEDELRVGDIHIGKVTNLVKNIGAAFVEVRKGIICYMSCDCKKVRQGDEVAVQVVKEAMKTKQAVVSMDLELSSEYCVITYPEESFTISRKIKSKTRREELFDIMESFRGRGFGVILRTSCLDASDDKIRREIERNMARLELILRNSKSRTIYSCIHKAKLSVEARAENLITSGGVDRVTTDLLNVYEKLKEVDDGRNIVQLYEDKSYSLDNMYSIQNNIEKLLSKHVWLRSGASLVIEQTEAFNVIDVNTEKAIRNNRNKESTFLKINTEAAVEIARQVRLRNLSGIILIDFINMRNSENMQALMARLQEEFDEDPVETVVVDATKLGIVEVTRKKIRRPLHEIMGKLH